MRKLKIIIALVISIAVLPPVNVTAAAASPIETADAWARDGITSAISKGFVPSSLQGAYKSVITRAEFCGMAVNWLEYKTGKSIDALLADKGTARRQDAFSDTSAPDILAAYALGITGGTVAPTADKPGQFTPDGQFSREQAAAMIRNTCKAAGMDISNVASAGFTDIGLASSWAVDGINFVLNNGIMGGTSTTALVFSPKGTFTRQESIVTFNNIKETTPVSNTLNISASLKKGMTEAEFEQAYAVAAEIASKYAGKSKTEQLQGIYKDLRYLTETALSYSTTDKHYADVYGFFVLHSASCAGATRAVGLCLNILGISFEHVNENKWSHQWCRVNVDGEYWICDAYGMYVGPEPSPYTHPWLD